MKYAKLRIAWSMTWGIAALSLVALDVRSYWRNDILTIKPPEVRYVLNSAQGRTDFFYGDRSRRTWDYVEPWIIETAQIDEPFEAPLTEHGANYNHFGVLATRFHYQRGQEAVSVSFPTWYSISVVAGIAALPWFLSVRRFSLRTLLITTTLIAIGLGVIVWRR